jgi:hypothetical protein
MMALSLSPGKSTKPRSPKRDLTRIMSALAPLAPHSNRVLRVMLHTHWSAEAWSHVRVEFKKALALRSEIRGRGGSTRSLFATDRAADEVSLMGSVDP